MSVHATSASRVGDSDRDRSSSSSRSPSLLQQLRIRMRLELIKLACRSSVSDREIDRERGVSRPPSRFGEEFSKS